MKNKCLYCYEPVDSGLDFHQKCSQSFFGTPKPPALEYTIDQMDELAKHAVERSVAVPGVQAKLSMSIVKETKETSDNRLTVIGALGGQFILKPPVQHYPEMPANEHVTMRIAESFGIRVVPSSLIRLKSGELSYVTRRIDRTAEGEKIHMIDMFQITEAFDKYRSSMEKVGKAIDSYSSNTLLDKILYFELSVFSFLFGNNDMHLKNFSMIESHSGWLLSPAYDLLNVTIINPDDPEELALTLSGTKRKLGKIHFVELGESLGLTKKQIESTFNRMVRNKSKAEELLHESFLSEEMKNSYHSLMDERYAQMGL